jgi:hypothetical protein
MLVRLSTGFAIGVLTALAITMTGFPVGPGMSIHTDLLAFGLFLYLFASTMAVGYLATALMLDDT